jgi:hypothetical protein
LVFKAVVNPVATLRIVTVAPVMTAPLGSRNVPVMEPLSNWANAEYPLKREAATDMMHMSHMRSERRRDEKPVLPKPI